MNLFFLSCVLIVFCQPVSCRHHRYHKRLYKPHKSTEARSRPLPDDWIDPACNDLFVGGQRFNLTSLARPPGVPFLFFSKEQKYVYLLNVCRPLPYWQCGGETDGFVCKYVAAGYNFVTTVARWPSTPSSTLSTPSTPPSALDWNLLKDQGGLRIVTNNGDREETGSRIVSTLDLVCDREATEPVVSVSDGYVFSMQTKCACAPPHGCLEGGGSHSNALNPWPLPLPSPPPPPLFPLHQHKPTVPYSFAALVVFILISSTVALLAVLIAIGCHLRSAPRKCNCRCCRTVSKCPIRWPCRSHGHIRSSPSPSSPYDSNHLFGRFNEESRSMAMKCVGPAGMSDDDFYVNYGSL